MSMKKDLSFHIVAFVLIFLGLFIIFMVSCNTPDHRIIIDCDTTKTLEEINNMGTSSSQAVERRPYIHYFVDKDGRSVAVGEGCIQTKKPIKTYFGKDTIIYY